MKNQNPLDALREVAKNEGASQAELQQAIADLDAISRTNAGARAGIADERAAALAADEPADDIAAKLNEIELRRQALGNEAAIIDTLQGRLTKSLATRRALDEDTALRRWIEGARQTRDTAAKALDAEIKKVGPILRRLAETVAAAEAVVDQANRRRPDDEPAIERVDACRYPRTPRTRRMTETPTLVWIDSKGKFLCEGEAPPPHTTRTSESTAQWAPRPNVQDLKDYTERLTRVGKIKREFFHDLVGHAPSRSASEILSMISDLLDELDERAPEPRFSEDAREIQFLDPPAASGKAA